MTSRRRVVLAFGASTVASAGSFAQQHQGRVWRIGILSPVPAGGDPDPYARAFLDGMKGLGYSEGRDFAIEARNSNGNYDQLAILAAELVRLKLDVIIAVTSPAVSAMRQADGQVPIVFLGVADPVRAGFAVTLARPGGSSTGLSNLVGDLNPKRLELLKQTVPALRRVAILMNPNNKLEAASVERLRQNVQALGLQLFEVYLRDQAGIGTAFAEMAKLQVGGLYVTGDATLFNLRLHIAAAATEHRIPTMFPFREYTDVGGLMSYGSSSLQQFRHLSVYVDKIFRGTRAGDVPIEQPTKFELIINLKTAKTLGLTVPQAVLLRADEVID